MSKHEGASGERRRGASRLIDSVSVQLKGSPLASSTSSDTLVTSEVHMARRKANKKAAKLEYFQLVHEMRNSVTVKTRLVALRKEPNTVLMSDVVTWLMEHGTAETKIEALAIGSTMLEYGHLYAIDEEHVLSAEFSDRPIPLRFALDDRDIAAAITPEQLNSLRSEFQSGVRPSVNLRASRLVMSSVGTSNAPDSFTGADAVTWLMTSSGYARNRGDAVRIGQLLLDSGLFHRTNAAGAASRERAFCDSGSALFRYGSASESSPPLASTSLQNLRGSQRGDMARYRSEGKSTVRSDDRLASSPRFGLSVRSDDRFASSPRVALSSGLKESKMNRSDDIVDDSSSPRLRASPSWRYLAMRRAHSNVNSPRYARRAEPQLDLKGNSSAHNLAESVSTHDLAPAATSASRTPGKSGSNRTPAKSDAATPMRTSRLKLDGKGLFGLSLSGRNIGDTKGNTSGAEDDGPGSMQNDALRKDRSARRFSAKLSSDSLQPSDSLPPTGLK